MNETSFFDNALGWCTSCTLIKTPGLLLEAIWGNPGKTFFKNFFGTKIQQAILGNLQFEIFWKSRQFPLSVFFKKNFAPNWSFFKFDVTRRMIHDSYSKFHADHESDVRFWKKLKSKKFWRENSKIFKFYRLTHMISFYYSEFHTENESSVIFLQKLKYNFGGKIKKRPDNTQKIK